MVTETDIKKLTSALRDAERELRLEHEGNRALAGLCAICLQPRERDSYTVCSSCLAKSQLEVAPAP